MSVYLLPTFRSGAGHGSGCRCLSPLSYREKGRGMLFAPHHLIPPLHTLTPHNFPLYTSPSHPLHILLHVSHSPVESVRREGCEGGEREEWGRCEGGEGEGEEVKGRVGGGGVESLHPPHSSLYSLTLTPPFTSLISPHTVSPHTLPLLLPPHISHPPFTPSPSHPLHISHPPFTPSPSHPLHISHPPFTPSPSHFTFSHLPPSPAVSVC